MLPIFIFLSRISQSIYFIYCWKYINLLPDSFNLIRNILKPKKEFYDSILSMIHFFFFSLPAERKWKISNSICDWKSRHIKSVRLHRGFKKIHNFHSKSIQNICWHQILWPSVYTRRKSLWVAQKRHEENFLRNNWE